MLLAASMASQAVRFLIQADLLPSYGSPLYDTSDTLSQTSPLGLLLHGLIGYEAQPAGTQIISYVIVLVAIAAGMYWAGSRKRREARQHTLADAH